MGKIYVRDEKSVIQMLECRMFDSLKAKKSWCSVRSTTPGVA